MEGRANRSTNIQVYLTRDEKESLGRAAREEKTTMSEFIRRAVFPEVREVLRESAGKGREHRERLDEEGAAEE